MNNSSSCSSEMNYGNSKMINETILTMAKQINAKELKFAGFTLLCDNNKNEITIKKGVKFIRITYNSGSDLYDIQKGKIKKFDIIEEPAKKGYYADQLQDVIQSYFPNFEYVMDSIRIVGVNC
jgi:hypothetical protein